MARHRSPSGRRAHLGPPLSAGPAAAGVGAVRSFTAFPAASSVVAALASAGVPSTTSSIASSGAARFVASVVAGGALAAAGQYALVTALPAATDGANVLRLGVQQMLGPVPADAPDVSAARAVVARTAVEAVPPALPAAADAAGLVKAAGLREAAVVERARVAAAQVAAAKVAAASSSVPMIVGRLSSGFGGRWGTVHQGLDIAAPIGTPIRAPLAGTVVSSGPASGFGLWVRLRHADGTVTVYGHVNRSLVRVGQQVHAGDEIAEVGNRGQSTGPHLHIGVQRDGAYVDPRPWLDQHGIRY